MLGLSASVSFRHFDGFTLLWCDGQWFTGRGQFLKTAPGVPRASSMKEARTVGSAFIASLDAAS